MMKQILFGLMLSFTMTLSAQAKAQTNNLNTTQDLYRACTPMLAALTGQLTEMLTDQQLIEAGFCRGVIETLANTLTVNCLLKRLPRASLEGVGMPAMVQTFVNYARDNPQTWNESGIFEASEALEKAFPCTKR